MRPGDRQKASGAGARPRMTLWTPRSLCRKLAACCRGFGGSSRSVCPCPEGGHQKMRSRIVAIVGACVMLALPSLVTGQEARGTLQGRVSDATGAVVPGATVEVANVETGVDDADDVERGRQLPRPVPDPGHLSRHRHARRLQQVRQPEHRAARRRSARRRRHAAAGHAHRRSHRHRGAPPSSTRRRPGSARSSTRAASPSCRSAKAPRSNS